MHAYLASPKKNKIQNLEENQKRNDSLLFLFLWDFLGDFQTLWNIGCECVLVIVSDSYLLLHQKKKIYGAIVLRRKDYNWIYWNYSFCVCDDHCESQPIPNLKKHLSLMCPLKKCCLEKNNSFFLFVSIFAHIHTTHHTTTYIFIRQIFRSLYVVESPFLPIWKWCKSSMNLKHFDAKYYSITTTYNKNVWSPLDIIKNEP